MGGRAILNRNLDDLEITSVRFHFGLEKRTARSDSAAENSLQRVVGEQLKSAGHIGKPGTEQQIGREGSAVTDPIARERSVVKAAARAESASENAIVIVSHFCEQRWNVGRLMTESGI